MSDLIDRQAAIDAVQKYKREHGYDYYYCACDIERDLTELPSAQPEIIRCRDCKHYDPYDSGKAFCCLEGIDGCYPDDFCSHAERRTDE